MASISSGGQPCSVDTVTPVAMRGDMAAKYSPISGKRRFSSAMHSAHMGVEEASFMPSIKASIFSVFMPARS